MEALPELLDPRVVASMELPGSQRGQKHSCGSVVDLVSTVLGAIPMGRDPEPDRVCHSSVSPSPLAFPYRLECPFLVSLAALHHRKALSDVQLVFAGRLMVDERVRRKGTGATSICG